METIVTGKLINSAKLSITEHSGSVDFQLGNFLKVFVKLWESIKPELVLLKLM